MTRRTQWMIVPLLILIALMNAVDLLAPRLLDTGIASVFEFRTADKAPEYSLEKILAMDEEQQQAVWESMGEGMSDAERLKFSIELFKDYLGKPSNRQLSQ